MSVGDSVRYLEGFATEMASVGYAPLTISGYLDSTIHFGGWLQARGLSLTDINEQIVKAFGAHRCKCPGRRSYPNVSGAYIARVERFVRYLGQQGVIRPTVKSIQQPPSSLIAFREWLLQHRGLAPVTIDRHERLLKQMLPTLGADAALYTAATVRAAILGQIRGRRPAYAKTFVGALRIYLRFLATSGACQPGLDHALPTVAEWKLSSLPRYLNSGQASRLHESCRRDGPLGSRDRAIMLLLLRLGLRAGDIASMRPADIDWQEATVLVRGKGRRDVRLPLPQDAGDAVLEYLEHERPRVTIDRIFLCANAPFRALRSGGAVSDIVRGALRTAGIDDPPTRGANLIRHTTATTMLRAGATLDEIGTILRHKSPDTTAHYAKVDVATLQHIAQPWPRFKEGK
ncbi:MAG: tyrosine-type recombinase/integrase [Bryobacteraceae bacterium]